MKILAICGYSGSGKTTLLKKLIPLLRDEGVNIGVIKHSHHDVEVDKPGKDSYELRKAGANQTILASDSRFALMVETPNQQSINLNILASKFENVDLVLVEGFKDENSDKLVVHRQAVNKPLFVDSNTLAIISDANLNINIPQFDINNPQQIKKFILSYLEK